MEEVQGHTRDRRIEDTFGKYDVMVIISEFRPPNGHSADFLMTAMDA